MRATVPATNRAASATIEEMAERVFLATDGDLIVRANSMGGRVALKMGHPAPHRWRALVLANANTEGLG